MKIAVVSDDGRTVSQHFGRAPFYVVYTVENGRIASSEKREKAGHHTFGGQHEEQVHREGHGFGAQAQSRHAAMADSIADCSVVITGGMGRGAYESMTRYDIEPIVTDITVIKEAVDRYIQNDLPNLMERLH